MALTPSARPKGRPEPKRWRPVSIQASSTLLRLAGVDAGEAAGHLLGERGPAGVQAYEVRREQHRGLRAAQLLHGAGQLEPLARHLRLAVPQPAAIQPGLREAHEDLAAPGARAAAASTAESTSARFTFDDVPARQDHEVQEPAQQPSERAHPGQGKVREHAHEENAQLAHGVPSARARLLVAGIAPEVLLRALADQLFHLRVHLRRRAGGVGGQLRPARAAGARGSRGPRAGARPRPAGWRRRSAAPGARRASSCRRRARRTAPTRPGLRAAPDPAAGPRPRRS